MLPSDPLLNFSAQAIHPIGLADLGRAQLLYLVRIGKKPDTVATALRFSPPNRLETPIPAGFALPGLTAANCSLKVKVHVFHCA